MTTYAKGADVEALKSEGFNVLTRPAFNVLYLAFNQSGPAKAALSNVKVRQALAYAVNRDAIVKSKYPDGSTVALEFQPPGLDGYNDAVTKYEYNPDRAAEGEAKEAPKKAKGVGDRIKQAAQRMRASRTEGGSKAQAGGQTRGKAQKSTTPRKAGGS